MKLFFFFIIHATVFCNVLAFTSTKDISPSDYRVLGLEQYGNDDEMYSGYMPLKLGNCNENEEGSYFFWLAKQRHLEAVPPPKESLVIWLNGGPGCSSMVGMMHENGPFTVEAGGSFHSLSPTASPTKKHPTTRPSRAPVTSQPTVTPSTLTPSTTPTTQPTVNPSTLTPSTTPTTQPTITAITSQPTTPVGTIEIPPGELLPEGNIHHRYPTKNPTNHPTYKPVSHPTQHPIRTSTDAPQPVKGTVSPTYLPSIEATIEPTIEPSFAQTFQPTISSIPDSSPPTVAVAENTGNTAVPPTEPSDPPQKIPGNPGPPLKPVDPEPSNPPVSMPDDPFVPIIGRKIQEEVNNEDYFLKKNDFSWSESAHMIYLEQPIRTGFSKAATGAKQITTEEDVADDFYDFMQSFLTVFKEYQGLPVYITGESYAGMYIPWIAQKIVKKQENIQYERKYNPVFTEKIYINLQGVAIGNGVIDEETQDATYPEYAYTHGLIPIGAKDYAEEQFQKCDNHIKHRGRGRKHITHGDLSDCDTMSLVLDMAGRPNEYNTNTFKQYDNLTDPDRPFLRFMNDPVIQEKIHVRGRDLPGLNFNPEIPKSNPHQSVADKGYFTPPKWQTCNDQINEGFASDKKTSSVSALQYLSSRIRVLLYSGEFDLNTNILGTLRTLEKNSWLGKHWNTASRGLWFFEGDVAGEYFDIKTFAFLIVRKSGHLVPTDIPAAALEMFNRFLIGKTFSDKTLPSDVSYVKQRNNDMLGVSTAVSSRTYKYGIFCISLLSIAGGVLFFVRRKNQRGYSSIFTQPSSSLSSDAASAASTPNTMNSPYRVYRSWNTTEVDKSVQLSTGGGSGRLSGGGSGGGSRYQASYQSLSQEE
mmetsp:Transcript_29725/g.28436  ORF Transcript_29725/g.28436 Transcript_29725/m.28436 type:complete len:866 (-) Transcript_29725:73-2670(-)